ncbi:MAG: TolC family protein [Bacteroidetes bacterium]|nr:TolC family protein [Bacteroidota bacterium]
MKSGPLPAVKPLPAQYEQQQGADSIRLIFKELFPDTALIALVDSAMRNNNPPAIARQRILSAEAALMARKGARLPSIDAVLSGGAERYGEYTMNGVGNFDTNLSPNIDKDHRIPVKPTTDMFIGFRSSWEIDLWGKLKHLAQAAQADLQAVRASQRLLSTTLVAEVAGAYYNLMASDRELAIVRKNIVLQEEAVEIVKGQKSGGRANELAVQQFRAQLLNTKAIEYRILQERTQVQNSLNALAGRYPQLIARDTIFPEVSALHLKPGVPASLLYRRPDIQQAEYELLAAKENIQAARAAFLPSLVINPYVAFNAFTPSLLFNGGSGVYGVTGGLTAPIFRQRALRAQFIAADAAGREASYNYGQKLLDAYSEVLTQLSAVDNYKQAYALNHQEVLELQAGVASARELYRSGYATYLEVITAQKNVLEAELRLAGQQRDIMIAMVQLYRALGGGWE